MGFRVESELNEGLQNISNMKFKALIEKAVNNLKQGYFEDDIVEMEGELHCACPPNAAFILGNILSKFAECEHLFILSRTHNPKRYNTVFIEKKDNEHIGNFDIAYALDAVKGS